MKYAINLADLTAYVQEAEKGYSPVMAMIGPVLDKHYVSVGKNLDDNAVLLNCDEERAEAITQVVRDIWKIPKHKLRMYGSRTGKGGWKKI